MPLGNRIIEYGRNGSNSIVFIAAVKFISSLRSLGITTKYRDLLTVVFQPVRYILMTLLCPIQLDLLFVDGLYIKYVFCLLIISLM